MSAPSRGVAGLLASLVPLLTPSVARAWATVEHQELGREAYLRACAELVPAITARGAADDGVRVRLEIACGKNTATLAAIYGDAVAIAGDYLAHPAHFLTQYGAWTFNSRKHYWLLALENVEHFNPMATRSWADYHQTALRDAVAGAASEGLAAVDKFETALQESAFADHFLQDSFAAGHMGFNRTASSAAAAKRFHDTWNARGRAVCNRAGQRWRTYGDEFLNSQPDLEGRSHVLDASVLSIRDVLRAYVAGARSPDDELAIWRALPFAINAPELLPEIEEVFEAVFESQPAAADTTLTPLAATIRPARKDTVLTATFWSAAPFEDAGNPVIAGLAGMELALPIVPAQTYLGAGATLRQPNGGGHSAVVDTGVLFPVGLSVSGLISHQLDVTASWVFRSHLDVIAHLEYQLNIELGDALLSAQVGIAGFLPQERGGWYGALGLGFTFSAAGGGGF